MRRFLTESSWGDDCDMKKTIKYTDDLGFFYKYLKKHTCPRCGGKVQMRYMGRLMNLQSPEAAECGFSGGEGIAELRTIYFYCPNCPMSISLEDMREFEKGKN